MLWFLGERRRNRHRIQFHYFVLSAQRRKTLTDLSWVKLSHWKALTDEERRGFPPLCPDFVVELRSHIDSLAALRDKMLEYIANGAQLGWLIDPLDKKVYVYRPQTEVECLNNPANISGGELLAGFTLDLAEVW